LKALQCEVLSQMFKGNFICIAIKIQQAYIRSQVTVEQPRMGESRFGPFSTCGTKLQGFWITKTQLVEKQ